MLGPHCVKFLYLLGPYLLYQDAYSTHSAKAPLRLSVKAPTGLKELKRLQHSQGYCMARGLC